MNDTRPPRPLRPPGSRRVVLLVAASIGAGIIWTFGPPSWKIGGPRSRPADRTRPRDVYADSPYRNARPGVGYVGDAACARCHREIARAYREHPMGRSLAPLDGTQGGPPLGAAGGLPVVAQGVRYTVERREGRLLHRAWRQGSDGNVFAAVEAEVRYALGSGTRGIAYLIERDGFLFQSPIAWFAQEGRWGISPGYGEFAAQPTFERPIQADCLDCHANRFRPVAGTLNRYETPIFRGHAIGCERCHGPGELHVNRGGASGEPDRTIVNPADLASELRESVCQQCHLQGSLRFARAGREPLDFRPGLPFHRFWAVFLMTTEERGRFESVGHVEQMESSRCFRASGGKLGCISCHDPHRLPPPAGKRAYYRGRCLECHERRGCALPADERRSRGPGEDCIACHMPRRAMTNIPHTAATDHRIPRGSPGRSPEGPRAAPGQPADLPLMDYHWGSMTRAEQRGAGRDWGMALSLASRIMNAAPPLARAAAARALPFLEAALRDRPDDLAARESLGLALALLDRPEDALRAFEEVLRREPGRESTLRSSARVLSRLGRPDAAIAALRRAIAVDPWRSDHRLALAQACARAGDWPGAVAAGREAIRLNPELFEARSLLVQGYLRSHRPEEAEAEFQTLLRSYPAGREAWRHWYEARKKEAEPSAPAAPPR